MKWLSIHWRTAGRSARLVGLRLHDRQQFIATQQAGLEHQRARAFGQLRIVGTAERFKQLAAQHRILGRAEMFLGSLERSLATRLHSHFERRATQVAGHRIGIQLAAVVQAQHGAALPGHRVAHGLVLQGAGEELDQFRAQQAVVIGFAIDLCQAQLVQARAIDAGGGGEEGRALGVAGDRCSCIQSISSMPAVAVCRTWRIGELAATPPAVAKASVAPAP